MKRWQTLLLLLVVAFLPYSVALFTGQQLGPTEHIQTMVTPGAPEPTYGWDVLQADGVLQFLPWRDLVFDAWRKGEAPMMNPYQLAGQPLAANSQSGGFYPPHVIFAFVPGSTGFKIILLGILHLFIAGTGFYYLLRNLRISESGALLGATTFALSQFMVAWAPLASVPSTVAWIPWILAGITCANRKVGFFQVSFATAMMIYAGHLQFAFYGMFAAFVVWAWNAAAERKATALIPLVALLVGVIVAMPQLGIVLKNSKTSHRQNVPTPEGYDGYSKGALAAYEALSFISPDLLGNPLKVPQATEEASTATPVMPAFGYWSMLAKRGANPAECALWISPIALTLAFVGLTIRRPKEGESSTILPALLILVLGFLLTFGSPLNQFLFFNFPGWSATGSPGRAHVLIVLALCILAAIGYDRLEAKSDGSKKWYALALVPLVLLGLGFNLLNIVGGELASGFKSTAAGDILVNTIAVTTKPLLPGIAFMAIVSAAVLALFGSKKLPKLAYLPAGIIALTLIGQHPLSGKPLEVPTEAPTQERHVFVSRGWGMSTTPKANMPPNIASLARVHDLFGYDSMLDKGFIEKLKTALGGAEPAVPENGNLMMLRAKDRLSDQVVDGLTKLGVQDARALGDQRYTGITSDTRVENLTGPDISIPATTIEYDGYDHQIIKPTRGAKEILIRDRFIPGMTTPTPNTTVEDRDGWRLIKTDGQQTSIRIDYPGRQNWIGVIIGVAILVAGYVLVIRKHESNPPEA